MAKNRRKVVKVHTSDDEEEVADNGEVTDDSFRNANLSLMPEDTDNVKLAAVMPQMNVKAEMQPSNLKVVNRPLVALNRVQANLKDGDL